MLVAALLVAEAATATTNAVHGIVPRPWCSLLVAVGFLFFLFPKLHVVRHQRRISFGTALMTAGQANSYRLGYLLMACGYLLTFRCRGGMCQRASWAVPPIAARSSSAPEGTGIASGSRPCPEGEGTSQVTVDVTLRLYLDHRARLLQALNREDPDSAEPPREWKGWGAGAPRSEPGYSHPMRAVVTLPEALARRADRLAR